MQTKQEQQTEARRIVALMLTDASYVPTVSDAPLADRIDLALETLGDARRCWRGTMASVMRPSAYSEGARQVAEYEAECYRAGRNHRVARKGGLR